MHYQLLKLSRNMVAVRERAAETIIFTTFLLDLFPFSTCGRVFKLKTLPLMCIYVYDSITFRIGIYMFLFGEIPERSKGFVLKTNFS